MNNYFIFKNKNSKDISGLIVQELPPITKAPKRTNIIEIEGKDGDIIESLGYAAYDKTIQIGLTSNNNIIEIVNWLNGSGKLILSNEPSKYYEAEIVSQIDFDRLARFRTASITFHVQPYKYLAEETITDIEITDETSIVVQNQGLIESKPIITLYGSGNIEFAINGQTVFTINIDSNYVTIDAMKEDAYTGSILKNRQMSGEFNNIRLAPGQNTITWIGDLTRIEVDAKSRWL